MTTAFAVLMATTHAAVAVYAFYRGHKAAFHAAANAAAEIGPAALVLWREIRSVSKPV